MIQQLLLCSIGTLGIVCLVSIAADYMSIRRKRKIDNLQFIDVKKWKGVNYNCHEGK